MHAVASVVSNSATPWTVVRQAPLSMGFLSQEYWSGLPCPKPRNAPEWSKENFFLLPKCISNCHITQFSFLRFRDRFVGGSGEILSYSSRRTFGSDYLLLFFFFLLLFLRIYSCMDVTFGKEVIMLISLWEWIQHVDECWVNDSRGNGVKETGLSSSKRVHFFWYPAMGVHIFRCCLSQFQLHAAKGFQWGMFCHVFFGRISIFQCSPLQLSSLECTSNYWQSSS